MYGYQQCHQLQQCCRNIADWCRFLPKYNAQSGLVDIHTTSSGNLNFQIAQHSLANGSVIDVDFIIWGPFPNATCSPTALTEANQIACSYSILGIENFVIPNTQPGQYYKLLVTNFANQPGNIQITQTNAGQPGSGTFCEQLCFSSVSGGGTFCPGQMMMLTASIPDATNYSWSSSVTGPIQGNTRSIIVSSPATYTVQVTKPGCTANPASATVIQIPAPDFGIPNDLSVCAPENVFNLQQNTSVIQNGDPTLIIDYHTTQISANDASIGADLIIVPGTFQGTDGQTIYVSIENSAGCITTTSFTLHIAQSAPMVSVSVSDNTVTVLAIGTGVLQYSLDNGPYQASPVFDNVPLGQHLVRVMSSCGSVVISFTVVTPFAPDAISPQYFNQGDTVANLQAVGQNVQWYANATNKTFQVQAMSLPLPASTVLVNGTTYYASQTVNGVESASRMPVLALVTLGVGENNFSGLEYFPNPVKDLFTVANGLPLDRVVVNSMLGQTITDVNLNASSRDLNMENYAPGLYFLTIYSAGQHKIIKLLKE